MCVCVEMLFTEFFYWVLLFCFVWRSPRIDWGSVFKVVYLVLPSFTEFFSSSRILAHLVVFVDVTEFLLGFS